jgi:peroxiredoxin
MARTPSTMLPLGTPAPDFALPNIDGTTVKRDDFQGSTALVVMFICNHCPYVKHVDGGMVMLAKDYQDKGVAFVAISSNDVENYAQDSPEKMKEEAAAAGYTFPYLYDATQDVAKGYRAACTPDFYVFDGDLKLVYRGQLDDSRPGNDRPVTGKDIRSALDAVLAGKPVSEDQQPSIGCNIKWIPGNAPDYAGG